MTYRVWILGRDVIAIAAFLIGLHKMSQLTMRMSTRITKDPTDQEVLHAHAPCQFSCRGRSEFFINSSLRCSRNHAIMEDASIIDLTDVAPSAIATDFWVD
jgi:hypothetical protein